MPDEKVGEMNMMVMLEGFTLRDWFAGQYLTGIVASNESDGRPASLIAEFAYRAADALIAERGKVRP